MSWTTGTVRDVAALQRGHDLTEAERKPGDVPVIGSAGPNGFHDTAITNGPGVTIGRSGGSIGRVTYVDQDYWPHNTCIYVTDFKGNDPYLLGMMDLAALNSGAAQPSLNRNFVYQLRIRYPDVCAQRRIAGALAAYDDLIENNRRRMALLEESAQLLYREWFVHLRFPGYEHTRVVDGVPKAWQRSRLSTICSYLRRGITPRYDDDAAGLVINQKCIREARINLSLARQQSREFDAEKQLRIGDVLVNSTGEGTLGRVAQVKRNITNCTVDGHVTIVRPRPGLPRHLFGLAVMEWQPRLATMGKGATNQTELSPTAIGAIEILLPSHSLREPFELFVDPLYQEINNLDGQNDRLRAARDLLLPKLMSGELAV